MRRLCRASFSSLTCMTLLSALAVAPAFAQAPAGGSQAAPPPPQSLSEGLKASWNNIKRNVRESAEKVSDADYSFKPTPDVRSFGGMVGHIAETHFFYCATMKGETSPKARGEVEKLTTKADLLKALDESNAYCETVYGTLTDAALTQMVKSGPREVARGVIVAGNIAHDNEHYGNLVTYMRLKGLVPPSTERAQAPRKPSQE